MKGSKELEELLVMAYSDTAALQETPQNSTMDITEDEIYGGQTEGQRNEDILLTEGGRTARPTEIANAGIIKENVTAEEGRANRTLKEAVIEYGLTPNADDVYIVNDADVDLSPEQRGCFEFVKDTLGDDFIFYNGKTKCDASGFTYNRKVCSCSNRLCHRENMERILFPQRGMKNNEFMRVYKEDGEGSNQRSSSFHWQMP